MGILGATGALPAGTGWAPTHAAAGLRDILGTNMGRSSPTLESYVFLAPIVASLPKSPVCRVG